jgi:uroporphyrinogen decarboxylase
MPSRQRVFDVLNGKIPDRVPYFDLLISQDVISKLYPGANYLDFCDNEDIDIVFTKWKFKNTWIDEDAGIYKNEWGMVRKRGAEDTDDYLDGPLHSHNDLKNFTVPDPEEDAAYENLLTAVKRFKEEKALAFFSKGTFNHVWYLFGGMEEYFIQMYTDPQFILEINEMVTAFHLAQVEKAITLGADIIAITDDYAFRYNSFIPRDKFEKFALPALKKMVELAHSLGAYVLFHSDGNIMEYLDLIIDAGIDMLHPLEPGAMDIQNVYDQYHDEVTICGNLDCADTLTFGSKEQVTKETLWLLKNIAPKGRYMFTSSNTIHSKVDPEVYKTMLDTLREYGRYPIEGLP